MAERAFTVAATPRLRSLAACLAAAGLALGCAGRNTPPELPRTPSPVLQMQPAIVTPDEVTTESDSRLAASGP